MLEDWNIKHIFWEENNPTDNMVIGGSKGIDAEYITGNLPHELYNAISSDGRGRGVEKKLFLQSREVILWIR